MGNDGLVISDSEPTTQIGKFTWLQVLPDGSRKWYEKSDGGWVEVKSEDAPVSANHSHPTHGDINLTGIVSVGGVAGLNLNTQDEIKKITNLVIVNGIITQFEYEL